MEHDPDDCHICKAHKLDKAVEAAMEGGRGLAADTSVTLDGSFNLRLVVAKALASAGVQVDG